PPADVRALAERMRAAGVEVGYAELTTGHGHDAFLADADHLAPLVAPVLDEPRAAAAQAGGRPAAGCAGYCRGTWYWWFGASSRPSLRRRLTIRSKRSRTSRPRMLRSVARGSVKAARFPRTRAVTPSSLVSSRTVATSTKGLVPEIPARACPGGWGLAGSP